MMDYCFNCQMEIDEWSDERICAECSVIGCSHCVGDLVCDECAHELDAMDEDQCGAA